MTKHPSVAIQGLHLAPLFESIDGDTELCGVESIHDDSWYVANWPEHVSAPRYNADCTLSECTSRIEAFAQADNVHLSYFGTIHRGDGYQHSTLT